MVETVYGVSSPSQRANMVGWNNVTAIDLMPEQDQSLQTLFRLAPTAFDGERGGYECGR